YDDAKEFSDEFGEDEIIMRRSTYKYKVLGFNLFPSQYRDTEQDEYRFKPTFIRDGMPRFHYIHHLMQGGKLVEPGLAKGIFVPRNWEELREWESPLGMSNNSGLKALNKGVKGL